MRKFWAYFKTVLADAFIYRAEGIIWMLNDIGPALIAIIFWLAAFQTHDQVAGYNQSQMVIYYLAAMFFNNLVNLQPQYYLAEEIKDGSYSNYLLKPINLLVYKLASSAAWRVVRSLIFLPILLILIKTFSPDFSAGFSIQQGLILLLSMLLTFWINYLMKMVMALTAVWLIEISWMFFAFDILNGLLSGEIVPLDIMPAGLNAVNNFLPFKYLLYFPVSLFLGKISAPVEVLTGLAIQSAWLIFFAWLYRLMWRKSARVYTAHGG